MRSIAGVQRGGRAPLALAAQARRPRRTPPGEGRVQGRALPPSAQDAEAKNFLRQAVQMRRAADICK